MTSGREQTVRAKNSLQRSHKIDNGQIRVESGGKNAPGGMESWRQQYQSEVLSNRITTVFTGVL